MLWVIGIFACLVAYSVISHLTSIVEELKAIRLLLNESEAEKFKRKQEEYREP